MEEVLAGTADYDRRYPSMKQTYQDVADYRDGVFSLFSPYQPKRKHAGSSGACSGAGPGRDSGRTS